MFDLLGSKLHMSTADHPKIDGQTERANRVVADVLRPIATPKEWRKGLPFMEFAIKNNVHASTGEIIYYLNGLCHPRTPVSFVRIPSLSGVGPLTTLGANAEERNGFANVMAENRSSDPVSAVVVTTQDIVKLGSRHTFFVLQSNDDASSLASTTHD